MMLTGNWNISRLMMEILWPVYFAIDHPIVVRNADGMKSSKG